MIARSLKEPANKRDLSLRHVIVESIILVCLRAKLKKAEMFAYQAFFQGCADQIRSPEWEEAL